MTKNEITFEGETWAQMSKSRRIASLKFCMDHIFDKHVVQHKWICRWLVLYTPEIDQRQWRKLLKPLRERVAEEQIEMDMPKVKISHIIGLTDILKDQVLVESRQYCGMCDGVGWYEGGPTLKTSCNYCNGTGWEPTKDPNQTKLEL